MALPDPLGRARRIQLNLSAMAYGVLPRRCSGDTTTISRLPTLGVPTILRRAHARSRRNPVKTILKNLPLLLLMVAVAACTESVAPARQSAEGIGARFDGELDCDFEPAECAILQAGIDHLVDHANDQCKAIGLDAQARLDAPPGTGYGYRRLPGQSQDGGLMGVYMYSPANTVSGWAPVDGYTGVYDEFWTYMRSPATTGGLIAHEEAGHHTGMDGYYHNTGHAAKVQDMCTEN